MKSDGFRGTLFASHPVIRSREQNLFVGLSFDFIENDIEQSLIPGTPIIQTADDSLRVLRANASYDFVDDFLGVPFIGVNLVTVEVSQGLDIWDASREGDVPLTRANGDGEFTTVNVSATRVQQIAQNWSVRLAFAGQYASEALLSAEEFGVGGAQFGRGYDPSEITGDHGVAASAELQYGRVLDRPWLDSYQAYLFYDYGRVYDIGEDTDDQYLDSTGGGVRLNISDQFSAQLEIARQLSLVSQSNEEDDRETRFLFSITGRI